MSTTQIQQPLLDGGIHSVNFFNGRLLSGEDLSMEQEGNRQAHSRLGKSVGAGVVTGLNVTQSPPPLPGEPDLGPKVTVSKGMAINSAGQTLLLYDDIDVQLVSTPNDGSATPGQGAFSASQAAPQGQYVLGEGVYLLTIASTQANDGSSPVNVSAFSNSSTQSSTASCTTSYSVDTAQFRLIQLTLGSGLLVDADHLRNKIAYACFGFPDELPNTLLTPPDYFDPFARNARLLETLQQNSQQDAAIDLTYDVPLAILGWKSSGNPDFIDQWSVRRRLIHQAYTSRWQDVIGDQRQAEAEAMFLQFQSQIDDILQGVAVARQNAPPAQNGQPAFTTPNEMKAEQVFNYLPAAGYLPVGSDSFDWKTFLGPLAPSNITCVDRRFFRLILHNSFFESPIKVGNYADDTPSNEPPVDVYQDTSQPGFVLFARSNSGRSLVTVDAQGYQPASIFVSFTVGQQTQLTIPLKHTMNADGPQSAQPALTVDVEQIERPALHRVRFSVVQQPAKAADVLSQKIQITSLPPNVLDWLSKWQTWFHMLHPNQGIDCSVPAIYMNDYYSPPKPGAIPQEPSAYVVFGDFAVPLLVTLSYYTTPLPVPLARARESIGGLTDDEIQALASIGINYVDQVVGAWSQLLADAVGQPVEFGTYLITDALAAIDNIDTHRLYYRGIDALIDDDTTVAKVLEEMALSDDVSLANADQDELGQSLHSVGFANRLIAQARQAVPPEHWSLESLGLPLEQIPSLKQIGISSKGQFARKAENSAGHKQLESALQQDPQTIDQLRAKANQQITASSISLARVKDLILLPNVNAEVATKLAASNITTLDQVHQTEKEDLMQITGLSEDATEDIKKEAKEANKEGLEVVKLASVTKEVANILDTVLQVKTVSDMLEQGEAKVAEALQATHGDRAIHFVRALFKGIRGAGR